MPSSDPRVTLRTESDDTAHVVHVEGELDLRRLDLSLPLAPDVAAVRGS